MLYVKAVNGVVVSYPYSQTDLRRDNPSTSFPANTMPEDKLAKWNVFPVRFTPSPDFDTLTHRLVETVPLFADGVWQQQWAVEALSSEQVAANKQARADEIRAERNRRLIESDWTRLDDSPLDEEARTAWANYRQALRDITSQAGFPTSVTWPDAPSK